MRQVCRRCDVPKPLSEFYPRNKVCKNARLKANPLTKEQQFIKAQKYHLKKKYGMTVEDYETMLAAQKAIAYLGGTP